MINKELLERSCPYSFHMLSVAPSCYWGGGGQLKQTLYDCKAKTIYHLALNKSLLTFALDEIGPFTEHSSGKISHVFFEVPK